MNTLRMKKLLVFSMSMMLVLAVLIPATGRATAQAKSVAPNRTMGNVPSQQQGPTDPVEVEAFLDELLGKQMAEHHIAGAAVAVVKDGKIFFAKGYGYADLEEGLPVDPEQTLFRIGSVGKVFTWTAVMQLVEQGKLDLDADINTYLDFRIPDTYPQPVTLKHLMAHTSGFEERWLESLVSDASELMPAREWLVTNTPGRVRPPGEVAGYSNYNAMLAGYIVERVSGQPYDQYIQEHILNPLGMMHSTATSPLSPELSAQASVGYTYQDDNYQAFPDYTAQPAGRPSGIHWASVTDMARFMIALLQDGRYGEATTAETRILQESTVRQMHSTLYTPDPRLLGTAYGLFDLSDNGQRTLGHSGYFPPMHSLLMLLPDQKLGVFVAYNSVTAEGLTIQHRGFQRAFFDHYYPVSAAAPLQPPADFAERAGRFVGLYRYASSHATTPERIMGLLGFWTIEVSAPGDGTLLVPIEGLESRFVEVEPLYFRQVNGPFALVFREDDRGRITHLFTDLMPEYAAVRLAWYETPTFHMVLALACVLIFLTIIPAAVIYFIRNRRLKGDAKPESGGARLAGAIILGICLLNLLFLAGVAIKFPPVQPTELHDIALITKIALGLGAVAALLTAGALLYTVLAWTKSYWNIAGRAYYTLVTVAAVAFVWFLDYWKWLGWQF